MSVSYPCLAVAVAPSGSVEVCVVVERVILATLEDFVEALFVLVQAAYFAFDMEYPTPFKALMLFIQHLVMEIIDDVQLLASATSVFIPVLSLY